jgi:hypothetical protein
MHIHNQAMGGPGALSEAALFQRAQAGCPDSLNALMIHHDGLVQAVVRRQVLGDLPFTEALQAGRIGLWRAPGLRPQAWHGLFYLCLALHRAPRLASGEGVLSLHLVVAILRGALLLACSPNPWPSAIPTVPLLPLAVPTLPSFTTPTVAFASILTPSPTTTAFINSTSDPFCPP